MRPASLDSRCKKDPPDSSDSEFPPLKRRGGDAALTRLGAIGESEVLNFRTMRSPLHLLVIAFFGLGCSCSPSKTPKDASPDQTTAGDAAVTSDDAEADGGTAVDAAIAVDDAGADGAAAGDAAVLGDDAGSDSGASGDAAITSDDAGADGATAGDAAIPSADAGTDGGTLIIPTCTSGHWCWENPLPQGNPFNALFAVSATDVWAVGPAGLTVHWDGATLKEVPTATTNGLNAVWGASANDVWAVGDVGTIIHWNGATWSSFAAPSQAASHDLKAISGSGALDVWVGGIASINASGDVLHWDGSGTWQYQHFFSTFAVAGAAVTGPGDVWMVGSSVSVAHYKDGAWSVYDTNSNPQTNYSNTPNLYAVWAGSDSDVRIVGSKGVQLHWNGSSFASGGFSWSYNLLGVWGGASNDVWEVSYYGLRERWDGQSWTKANDAYAAYGPDLMAITGTATDNVFAGGGGGCIFRWQGASWAPLTLDVNQFRGGWLNAIWGASNAQAWAVGDQGSILRWDGAQWSSFTSPTTSSLKSVHGAAADDVWAVGANGTVLHWQGSAWTPTTTGLAATFTTDLYGVYALSTSDVWMVGANTNSTQTFAAHWDGEQWTERTAQVPQVQQGEYFYGVWGADSNQVFAVGSRGSIVHWTSSPEPGWSTALQMPLYNNANFVSLYAIGGIGNSAWAVGEFGQIARWDGNIWSVWTPAAGNPLPGYVTLNAVWGTSGSDLYLGGNDGLWHWDGNSLTQVDEPLSPSGIWGPSSTDIHLVGQGGAIMRHLP